MPDFLKLVGAQLFETMHSLKRDDTLDRFYAAEKGNVDDSELLEASGFFSLRHRIETFLIFQKKGVNKSETFHLPTCSPFSFPG